MSREMEEGMSKTKSIKYKNYEELIGAYKRGDLTNSDKIIIESDQSYVYNKDGECVFRGQGQYDIYILCDLLGIPVGDN